MPMTREDFWDPEDAGVDMPRETDPDAGTPEWYARRTRWQQASRKKDRNVEGYLVEQGQHGVDADTALQNAGFADLPDQGRATFRQYGNQGLYATQGAAVDPNLDYDWARGIATWRPGTDNAGQSRPINATEREEYAKAQRYRQQGVQGYGQMRNAELFNQWGKNHYTDVPGGNGVKYHIANDGTVSYVDKFGRATAGPKGWAPPELVNYIGGGNGPTGPTGSYLPSLPGQSSSPVENYNQMWSGLATGQPAMPQQGYSPAPTTASFRASQEKSESTDASSPYQALTKKKSFGTGSWGQTTPGGSNAGLKVGN